MIYSLKIIFSDDVHQVLTFIQFSHDNCLIRHLLIEKPKIYLFQEYIVLLRQYCYGVYIWNCRNLFSCIH